MATRPFFSFIFFLTEVNQAEVQRQQIMWAVQSLAVKPLNYQPTFAGRIYLSLFFSKEMEILSNFNQFDQKFFWAKMGQTVYDTIHFDRKTTWAILSLYASLVLSNEKSVGVILDGLKWLC